MSTWILLRGLTREKRHWGGFQTKWQEAFPGAKVVTMELPGAGELNAEVSPTTIEGMAARCHREALSMGLAPPYNLLAMSLGAMVAAAWAEQRPGDMNACVLINTSFGSFSPLQRRLRPRAWPILLRLLLTPSIARQERLIFKLTSNLTEAPTGLIDDWVSIRVSHPVALGNAIRQLFAAAIYRAPSRLKVPTLVLTSQGDRLVNPQCSRDIARQWDCALSVHLWAGHDLPLDDGAWILKEVHDWHSKAGLSPDGA
jgi:pimeloyl-ACP methyl ester carboxylesterase